ncbi:MAG: hypothetical protein J1F39_06575 [Clostridiales bacterium]|nr:hypothetical protein [Clostridiales bacterium]
MSNEEEKINESVPTEADAPAEESVTESQSSAPSEDAATETNATPDTESESKPETVEEAKPAKTAVNKPVKAAPTQKGTMNAMFKRIYFPLVIVLIVVMTVFSVVDALCGFSPKAYDDDYYTRVFEHAKTIGVDRSDLSSVGASTVADYIVGELTQSSFSEVDQVKDEKTDPDSKEEQELFITTDWAKASGAPIPTVTRLVEAPTSMLQARHSIPVYSAGKEITDIVAAIPSRATRLGKSSESVIITVRYDSRADSTEAALAGFVGAALESLIDYVNSGAIPKNDIVVVFTEDMDYAYGTYAFVDVFTGLDNVVSRAKAAVNLEAYGNGGTLAVTDATGAGLDYFNQYASLSGTAYNSSIAAGAIPAEMKNAYAVDAFKYADIPVVQVALLGNLNNAQSPADNYSALSNSSVRMMSDFLKNYLEFAGETEKEFKLNDNKLVFFSYFDWGTVAYDNIAAYVIAAITLVLIIAAIALTATKKTFSLYRMLVAVGVGFLVFVSSIVAMFAAYFLVTLMLTGFGVLPIHAIVQVRYFNVGILIASLLIAFASAFGFTSVYKKLFKVTSSDTVRGNALLVALIGAVLGFAAPAYSYVVSWLGLLMAAVLLVTVCLNKKFKDKFGYGMDRLFPFVLPVLITLPLTVSTITTLSTLWPLYLLPVVMLVFVAMLGSAVPYLDRSVVFFDKIAKKLPMRTRRVERTVTERVEDRAKKGKFTERTVRRVENEKVPVNYKNYFGISLVTVVAVVIALLSGGFGATFGQTVTSPNAYASSIYNNSIVYEWTKSAGGSISQRLIVGDLITYKYARYAIDDLVWDSELGMYTKEVNDVSTEIIDKEPNITSVSDGYQVTTFEGSRSVVTLTIPSAKGVTKIKITDNRDSENNKYEYSFDKVDTIVLRLPYGLDSFRIQFEGSRPSTIQYEEQNSFIINGTANRPFENLSDRAYIEQYYSGTELWNNLRGGIVLKATFSL